MTLEETMKKIAAERASEVAKVIETTTEAITTTTRELVDGMASISIVTGSNTVSKANVTFTTTTPPSPTVIVTEPPSFIYIYVFIIFILCVVNFILLIGWICYQCKVQRIPPDPPSQIYIEYLLRRIRRIEVSRILMKLKLF